MELLCVLADELFEEFGGTYVEVRATPFSSPSVVEVEIEDLIVKGGRNNSFSRGVENADCVRFKKSGSGAILVAFGVNGVWRTR
jgi:hypothetical protein